VSAVIVLGDGVDALVAAHYLARGGHDVTIVRERANGNGNGNGDVLEPGWAPPKIARDLDLGRHGLVTRTPEPWAVVPPEEGGLELSADIGRSAELIKKLSARDAAKWPEFCARMHALARVLEHIYIAPPPDPTARARRELIELLHGALRVRGLGRRGIEDLLRLLPMPVADWLDDWFESDMLKGVLGAGGVMHLAQGPRSGGTAFNLLHHCVGSPAGVFRPMWTNARAVLMKALPNGVGWGDGPPTEGRRAGAPPAHPTVSRILIRDGRATGVVLTDGTELAAAAIVSALPPARTLVELCDPGWLDPELVLAVRNVRSRGVAGRVSFVLDREPRFTTLVIAPSLDYLERAYDPVKYGELSAAPYIEARYAGAPAKDRHVVEVHVQYVPHTPRSFAWDTPETEKLGRTVAACISEQVPGFSDWIIGRRVLTPADLEQIDGFPQGQRYHAELALDQVLWMRPVPQLARYRTPIGGLYLCGPAMHPGAGIAGAAGANAASILLKDLKAGLAKAPPRPTTVGRG